MDADAAGTIDAGRRAWLIGGAGALVASLLSLPGVASAQEAGNWQEVIRKLTNGARPVDGKLTMDLPEIAESGNTVPFTVSAESPMTEAQHVKSIHVIATENPQPLIAGFHFTPASGRAQVAGRLRLARTQDVVALAELSDGRFLMARRVVKVTVGGCGG